MESRPRAPHSHFQKRYLLEGKQFRKLETIIIIMIALPEFADVVRAELPKSATSPCFSKHSWTPDFIRQIRLIATKCKVKLKQRNGLQVELSIALVGASSSVASTDHTPGLRVNRDLEGVSPFERARVKSLLSVRDGISCKRWKLIGLKDDAWKSRRQD